METKILSKHWDDKEHASYEGYVKNGGYKALKKALEMNPDDVIEEVKKSNIRGRGGAGFPTGLKWSFIPKKTDKPKYVVCNADESEPGTFKDREFFRHDPHAVLEGIAICAWAIQANNAYIYIRGEFVREAKLLQKAIDEAYEAGVFGKNVLGTDFHLECVLHRGAGAYVCGEETGLLESIEGKKGQPRNKPPFPAVEGLFGCPTVINNVETLAAVTWVLANGAEAYTKMGTEKSAGTKLCSLSGPVKNPGVYEVEMGYPLRRLIEEEGGGMLDGKELLAVIPGGSSVPPLVDEEIDKALLSYESMQELGTALGTASVIVIPTDYSVVTALKVISRFYAEESCGQCVPCREGTGWLYRLLARIDEGKGTKKDLEVLESLANKIPGRTICALADAAAWPVRGFLRVFRDKFEAAVQDNS